LREFVVTHVDDGCGRPVVRRAPRVWAVRSGRRLLGLAESIPERMDVSAVPAAPITNQGFAVEFE
jgi:hypothetical protein